MDRLSLWTKRVLLALIPAIAVFLLIAWLTGGFEPRPAMGPVGIIDRDGRLWVPTKSLSPTPATQPSNE